MLFIKSIQVMAYENDINIMVIVVNSNQFGLSANKDKIKENL